MPNNNNPAKARLLKTFKLLCRLIYIPNSKRYFLLQVNPARLGWFVLMKLREIFWFGVNKIHAKSNSIPQNIIRHELSTHTSHSDSFGLG